MGRGAVYRCECPAHSFYKSLHFPFPSAAFGFAALLLLPVSELVKAAVDFLLMRVVRPRPMPRLDLSDGVPEEERAYALSPSSSAAVMRSALKPCALPAAARGRISASVCSPTCQELRQPKRRAMHSCCAMRRAPLTR